MNKKLFFLVVVVVVVVVDARVYVCKCCITNERTNYGTKT